MIGSAGLDELAEWLGDDNQVVAVRFVLDIVKCILCVLTCIALIALCYAGVLTSFAWVCIIATLASGVINVLCTL